MKDTSQIKDWRSTGRRIARRVLYEAYIEYKCASCGKTTTEPPKDAPNWFDEIWPESGRNLLSQLQAQHTQKDLENFNNVEYLKWLCASCHKLEDQKTEKGIAVEETKFF